MQVAPQTDDTVLEGRGSWDLHTMNENKILLDGSDTVSDLSLELWEHGFLFF